VLDIMLLNSNLVFRGRTGRQSDAIPFRSNARFVLRIEHQNTVRLHLSAKGVNRPLRVYFYPHLSAEV
jgi:hypothetical protein